MSLYTHIIPLAFIETLILVKASILCDKNITNLILVKDSYAFINNISAMFQ